MPIRQVLSSGKVPVKIFTDDIDQVTLDQLERLSQMPFIHRHVAAMPDAHLGRGSTIGSVIPTKNVLIPAAVGVDLGCGMMACRLNITAEDLPDSLHEMRGRIEASVPHGRTKNGMPGDKGSWEEVPIDIQRTYSRTLDIRGCDSQHGGLKDVLERHPKLLRSHTRTADHLGTLGGGNHFIEVCLDEEKRVWIMLHSGSRGVGNRIGSYFIEKAKEEMERWHVTLPDTDLAYLPEGSRYFDDYVLAVGWAQRFALKNREVMMQRTFHAVSRALDRPCMIAETAANCHHNYVEMEHHYGKNVWVTRKGAIRARAGDMGIIPGSMGAKSFIVRGKGSAESFHSCSHGAGRLMSRKEAKRRYTAEDLAAQTVGIECRKDADVVDEIPTAYKDIDTVMENQSDLVEVVHTLHQVLNVKG